MFVKYILPTLIIVGAIAISAIFIVSPISNIELKTMLVLSARLGCSFFRGVLPKME